MEVCDHVFLPKTGVHTLKIAWRDEGKALEEEGPSEELAKIDIGLPKWITIAKEARQREDKTRKLSSLAMGE